MPATQITLPNYNFTVALVATTNNEVVVVVVIFCSFCSGALKTSCEFIEDMANNKNAVLRMSCFFFISLLFRCVLLLKLAIRQND
jgi:hypothetical protein